jgi:hypothetical protein
MLTLDQCDIYVSSFLFQPLRDVVPSLTVMLLYPNGEAGVSVKALRKDDAILVLFRSRFRVVPKCRCVHDWAVKDHVRHVI